MKDPKKDKNKLEKKYHETPKRSFGGSQTVGDYGTHPAPRVGGKAPKPSGLKGASKSQAKAAKSMVRKGTGSGASAAAKRSKRRLY